MHRPRFRVILSCAIAILITTVTTAPAHADTTWTVTPGGAWSAASNLITGTDLESGLQFTCEPLSAHGTLSSGSGLPGESIGQITELSFDDCHTFFGFTPTMTALDMPWSLNAVSYDPTTGTTTARVEGVSFHITFALCSYYQTGTLNVTFSNSTQTLTIVPDGTLTATNVDPVNDCWGLIFDGDPLSLSADYVLDASTPQQITSP